MTKSLPIQTVVRSYCSITERAASSVRDRGREGKRGTPTNLGWGRATHFMKPLRYFRPKHAIFDTLFHTDSQFDIVF